MLKYKKLLGVLGISALLFSGCSNNSYEQKAMDDYIAYSKDFTKMESANMNAKMLMNMVDGDTTMKAKVTFDGDFLINEDDMQMKLLAAMSVNGLSIGDIKLYMKDLTLYMDLLGTKQKASMVEDMKLFLEAYKKSSTNENTITEATIKEQFKEFKYEDEEQGIISFQMDSEGILKKALEENPNAATEDITMEDIQGTMTFKDGTIKNMTMNVTLSSPKGQKVELQITCTIDSVNEIKSIEFPDFSDYVETDLEHGFEVNTSTGSLKGEKQPTTNDYEDLGGEGL